MPTQDKLQEILQIKNDIKTEINNSDLGIQVDNRLSTYANAVNVISSYITDETQIINSTDSFTTRITAEGSNVINGSLAKVNIIGGYSQVIDGNIVSSNPTKLISTKDNVVSELLLPQLPAPLIGLSTTDKNLMNYIDFENNVFVQRVGVVDLGTLTWTYNGTNTSGIYRMYSLSLQNLAKYDTAESRMNMLCAKYETITGTDVYTKHIGVAINDNGSLNIYDPDYNTSDSPALFKQAMQGVYLIYELATPIITPLTIEQRTYQVFKNGTETFDSNVPVYLDIDYVIGGND